MSHHAASLSFALLACSSTLSLGLMHASCSPNHCMCERNRRGHYIHFLETLHALSGRVAGTALPLEEEYRIHSKLLRRLPKVRVFSPLGLLLTCRPTCNPLVLRLPPCPDGPAFKAMVVFQGQLLFSLTSSSPCTPSLARSRLEQKD